MSNKNYYTQEYDEIKFYETIEDALRDCEPPCCYYDFQPAIYSIDTQEQVLLDNYIEIIQLSKEEIAEIELKIDQLIEMQEQENKRTSNAIRDNKPLVLISGCYMGIIYTKENRQEILNNEIRNRSYRWKI